ncbi:NAD+ synthase [Archaeoglobus neptunius]|uniref:NAD+ synthase n=1 Tax=Archaeoglobus neptunius TaxID=2798580 RepID=UPI0019290D72|nr:NAD+ synthase [Archaeoglobus neptunius]
MTHIRIALAQINPVVGDLEGNARKVVEWAEKAKKLSADIVVFPEMVITGYPPEDLLLKPDFVEDNVRWATWVARNIDGIVAIFGFVEQCDDNYNAAAVASGGKIVATHRKMYLPNYGVFDEQRYFKAGDEPLVVEIDGVRVGLGICEDIWYPDVVQMEALSGDAEIVVNINASPYHVGKWRLREKMLATRASDNTVFVAYLNMVGGQDELVFDGHSMVFGPDGELVARGKQFEEDLIIVDLDSREVLRKRLHDPRRRQEKEKVGAGVNFVRVKHERNDNKPEIPERNVLPPHPVGEIYNALVLGVRDYVRKNGFRKVVIGLSGGIDSSIVATIAVDALGSDNVIGVRMPSPYTSKESLEDAEQLAENLGIELITLPIAGIFEAYRKTLAPVFAGLGEDVTEENIQARIRGNLLMALSNKFGWLVLTTGNKSEMSVGYATLYGDMAGGFAVIKDVPKTLVYELAKYRNKMEDSPIPERVFLKPPSAELRPGQRDEDELPPYRILDPILRAYVEEDRSCEEIVAMGFDAEIVRKVIKMVERNEYKRRQAPPGIKITPRAFGKDWRFPITNHYLECSRRNHRAADRTSSQWGSNAAQG